MKRKVGFFILLLCVLSFLKVNAYAQLFAGGTGEPNDPYHIATVEQLISIGSDPNLLDKNFLLVNDIDLDPNLPGGQVFNRAVIAPDVNDKIGFQVVEFTGRFDGKGHIIFNLTIQCKSEQGSCLGLFGYVGSEGQIINLGIENAIVTGGAGLDKLGILAGCNRGIVMRCYTIGAVSSGKNSVFLETILKDDEYIGGLAGINRGTITCCYAASAATGGANSADIGGLVGWNSNIGTITNCCATGSLTGGKYNRSLGGLAGHNNGTIANCYATGGVTAGENPNYLGGLVGLNYSNNVSHCFWDMETSGINYSDGGLGLTTAQMMSPEIYSLNGWAGNPNWVLDSGNDYPRLVWERKPGWGIPGPVIDWLEGSGTEYYPYVITSAEQLARISTASILLDKHFILGNDIDMDPNLPGGQVFSHAVIAPEMSHSWSPKFLFEYVTGPFFTGSFDGNGYIIYNLTINAELPSSYLGLFGLVGYEGIIKNLGLENVSITANTSDYRGTIGHNGAIGALAGYSRGEITWCYATGKVKGDESLGGLTGYNGGKITRCYANVEVTGDEICLGGLVGYNEGTINNCYARGSVICIGYGGGLGGLVGAEGNKGPFRTIAYCYAAGSVSGEEGIYDVGGLVGEGSFDTTINCFWDVEATGLSKSAGGTGLTTVQMQDINTYVNAGWDFDNIWTISDGKDYPLLQPYRRSVPIRR